MRVYARPRCRPEAIVRRGAYPPLRIRLRVTRLEVAKRCGGGRCGDRKHWASAQRPAQLGAYLTNGSRRNSRYGDDDEA